MNRLYTLSCITYIILNNYFKHLYQYYPIPLTKYKYSINNILLHSVQSHCVTHTHTKQAYSKSREGISIQGYIHKDARMLGARS